MHVLHRPHLPHAATIAAASAAVAIMLMLVLAGTLNDLASTSGGGSPTAAPIAVQSPPTGAGWNVSPFTSLLRLPVPVPWPTGF